MDRFEICFRDLKFSNWQATRRNLLQLWHSKVDATISRNLKADGKSFRILKRHNFSTERLAWAAFFVMSGILHLVKETLHCQRRMLIWSRQPFGVFSETNSLGSTKLVWIAMDIFIAPHSFAYVLPTGPWQHTLTEYTTKNLLPIAYNTNLMDIRDIMVNVTHFD